MLGVDGDLGVVQDFDELAEDELTTELCTDDVAKARGLVRRGLPQLGSPLPMT